MPEIEITEVVEVYSADRARLGKKDVWITYTVDKVRPYMITLPAETATETTILAEIKKREAERAKLVGKKFTV
jgi:hypothetical protein